MESGFAHLHVHSDYSVLDGMCTVSKLLNKTKEYGMNALALTDHGNLFGAIDFYTAAKKAGIKPIIGCELYVAPGHRTDTETRIAGATNHHLVLLCENRTGYHNLCKLSSIGYLEGFYYKPRVDNESLAKYSEGLIASSACLGGRIPQAVREGRMDWAHEAIRQYLDIFGKDRFLIELMDHGMPEEEQVNPILVELAQEYGLKLIATNDAHYVDRADAEAHEALLCVQTQTTLDDENRFRFPNDEFYFRSPDEMRARFARWPEAVRNTVEIADRCNVEIPLDGRLIPEYIPPEGMTKDGYLHELVYKGLSQRYGSPPPAHYIERAEYEMGVIEKMKFVDYFLVVWDLIHYARSQGIPVGPGRGSGAGSIVAYCLYITNIDPMRYQLLFERFLNPDRISMPDFDIDFCYNRRDEMITYARTKYGEENVSQIITFGRMLAKNVIRNVGRVMGMPYGDVDRIAKLVPDELKIKLKDAVDKEPELKRLIQEDAQIGRLWGLAEKLEGTIGNCGTHAAGVVICDHPLTDHVALFKASGSETVATQAEMTCVEKVGLLKMDFLGLRTLTVVHDAVRLVKRNRGVSINIDYLEPNDAKTYELLRSGQTTGIFQLESSGMRDIARRIGLQSLEEMSALVALYRPGPMQFIDTYIENKYAPDKIKYDHPLLEAILKETYGIAVYQEQVMQIVQACAGFSLGQADILRRAMGKKKAELMAEQRGKFVEGCIANKISPQVADTLFDRIETFAGYGFNKSHSVAYAFVAYQTAYLKANYPVEFMCALLTSESGNMEKTALYVEECRRMNIDVLPPDINHSDTGFTVEGNAIRFGLGAIKNVGEGPTRAIVEEREKNGAFRDIYDFCGRLDSRMINRRLIESMNKAGAFASTQWNRRQVAEVIEGALNEGQVAQRERASGQISLFDMGDLGGEMILHAKPELLEWPDHELLQHEKDMLGLYVSGHPLSRHANLLNRYATALPVDLTELREKQEVVLGGMVGAVKIYHGGKGKMAFLTLETREGSCEVTVFSDLYEQKGGLLTADAIVMIRARVNYRNNEPGFVAEELFPIEEAEAHLTKAIHVKIPENVEESRVERLAVLLGEMRGTCDVYLHCDSSEFGEVVIHATSACRVAATPKLRRGVAELFGEQAIWFSSGMGLPTHEQPRSAAPEQPRWKKKRSAVNN